MKKYYFKQEDYQCLEKCAIKDDGTKIGSAKCQQCKYCILIDKKDAFAPNWIVCSKIEQATNNKSIN